MDHAIQLLAFLMIGVALGGGYFAGLWWTVQRLPRARRAGRTYVVSLVTRLAILLACYYAVLTHFGWQALLACLLGLAVSRLALTLLLRPAAGSLNHGRSIP